MDKEKELAITKEERERINDFGSEITKNKLGSIYTLTIIGQIEGHQVLPESAKTTKYEHILPLLAGIEESDEIDGLLILLNTVGGDIEAGLAIAEMIAGMKKPTVSLVLGGGHSVGCLHQKVVYYTNGQHDSTPGKNDRLGSWCAADFSLFPTNSGADCRLCNSQLRHF